MPRLAIAQLARRIGLREVVDARGAAADLLLRWLPPLEAGYRVEQVAGLDADALRVGQMARVLEGDTEREGMPLGRGSPASSSDTSTTLTSSPASLRCEPQPAALTAIASTPANCSATLCAIRFPSSRRPAWRWSAPQQA